MLSQARRGIGEFGVEKVSYRAVLFPDHVVEKCNCLGAHVVGQVGVPLRKLFRVGLHIGQAPEVKPFVDKLGGALRCAGVVEHSFELSIQTVVLEELAVLGGLEQLSIRRRTPNDVAHAGGQLVLAYRPGGAVAALVLDAI